MCRQGARPALSALIHKEFAISFRHHINNFHIQYVSLKAHWPTRRLSRASNRRTVWTNHPTAADVSLSKAHGFVNVFVQRTVRLCGPAEQERVVYLTEPNNQAYGS